MEIRSDFKEENSSDHDYFDGDESKRDETLSVEKKSSTEIIPNSVQVSWDLFRRYSRIYERGNPMVSLKLNCIYKFSHSLAHSRNGIIGKA